MTHDAAAAAPVVLVHGLWMHGLAMQPLRWQLERQGFSAHCFSYPSLSASLQQNLERLVALVRRATERPKPRKKTRPTLASKRRRLESKRQRGDVKRLRKAVSED